jgi:2-hydroxycyclohexanecarboxyl-CoA dehydrogenase
MTKGRMQMDLNLNGKTVIVTGGGSNIGRAIALTFAKEKANVIIADYDEAQGNKVADEAKAMGSHVLAIKTDVSQNDQVESMIKTVIDRFGQLDVLVNNVGWQVDDLFVNETRDKWERVVAINFWGMINCTRAVIDHMISRRSGSVVSLGSDAGRMGEYREGIYAGCKAGIIGLTKTLARELGPRGIRLNVVCPGLTIPEDEGAIGDKSLWQEQLKLFTPDAQQKATKAYPLRKLGKAQDIANAVAFMASDCAGHITGQTLSVSGGYTMM